MVKEKYTPYGVYSNVTKHLKSPMKRPLILILTPLLLINCNRKQSENDKTKIETNVGLVKKTDTAIVYWQTDFDTLPKTHEVNIENDIYLLELKTYSLNDSSIVRINDTNKPEVYKDIYHDRVTDIILKRGNTVILNSQVKTANFKDSLGGDFLKYSVLRDVKFDFIRSNRLYFKADIDVPDTDWAVGLDFAIFYRTDKKGRIDYWNVKEIE